MEAASKGASEGAKVQQSPDGCNGVIEGVLAPRVFSGRHSMGNRYLTHPVMSRTLLRRIEHMLDSSEYFFVSGGTIGTLTELMCAWNLASIRGCHGGVGNKVYLLKSWKDIIGELIGATGIYQEDRGLLTFVESAEELVELVERDWEQRHTEAVIR